MKEFLILLLVSFLWKDAAGVMCYWCSGVGDDRECENHPYATKTGPVYLNCRANFCLSAKVIDAETGYVKSFARLCDNVPRGNMCIRDTKLLTCYESCTHDLCNNGNPDPTYLPTVNYAGEIPTEKETKRGYQGIQTHDQLGRSYRGRLYSGQPTFRQRGSAYDNFISRTNRWRTTNERPRGYNPRYTGSPFNMFTSTTERTTFHGRSVDDKRGLEDLYDLGVDNKISMDQDGDGEYFEDDSVEEEDQFEGNSASESTEDVNSNSVLADSVNGVSLPEEEYYDDGMQYDLVPESLLEIEEEQQGIVWPRGDVNQLEQEEELEREEEEVSMSNMIIEEDREEGLIEPFKANTTYSKVDEVDKGQQIVEETVSAHATNESSLISNKANVTKVNGEETKSSSTRAPTTKNPVLQTTKYAVNFTANTDNGLAMTTMRESTTVKVYVSTAKRPTTQHNLMTIPGKGTTRKAGIVRTTQNQTSTIKKHATQTTSKSKNDNDIKQIVTPEKHTSTTLRRSSTSKSTSTTSKTISTTSKQQLTTSKQALKKKFFSSTKLHGTTHPVLISTVSNGKNPSPTVPAKSLTSVGSWQQKSRSWVTTGMHTAFVTENPWEAPLRKTEEKRKSPSKSDYSSLPSEHAENLVWTSRPMKYYPTTKIKIQKLTPPIPTMTVKSTTPGNNNTKQMTTPTTSSMTITTDAPEKMTYEAKHAETDDVDSTVEQSSLTDLDSSSNDSTRRRVFFDESATLGLSENDAGFLPEMEADAIKSGSSVVCSYVIVILISLLLHVLK